MITARSFSASKRLLLPLAGIAFFSGLVFFGHRVAQAQTQLIDDRIALTAMPLREGDDNTLMIAPGDKQQVQIRVRNSSEQPIRVGSVAFDFLIDDDGKTPIPLTDEVSNRWSLASWLTMVPNEQVVAPNETVAVNVLIEVPEDALPGGHYAMVVHRPVNESEERPGATNTTVSETSINQYVGTLFYVIVEGPINEEAFIRDFQMPRLTEFGPVPFSYVVENASDIHIKPKAHIEIFDIFGRKVDSIQVEPENVFPLMSREFEDEWNQVWGYGLYKAKLIMSYGTQGQVAVAQTQFWLFPFTLVLVILILILTMIAIIISVRRHYLHRKDNSKERIEALENKLRQYEGNPLDKFED